MAKLELADITSGYAAPSKYNNNNTLIEQALENTLSRDGTSPNGMEADLDMNSNKITNLAAPINNNDAARLADIQAATTGITSANLILISDADGHYTGGNVEAALDEVGDSINVIEAELTDIEADRVDGQFVVYPRTTPEISGSVTPTDLSELPYKEPARYGVLGDAVTDDAAAIQRQINACAAAGHELDLWGTSTGTYRIETPLTLPSAFKFRGGGYGKCGIVTIGCNGFTIPVGRTQIELQGFRLNSAVRYTDTPNTLEGIDIQSTTGSPSNYITLKDLFIDGFQTCIQANGLRDSVIENVNGIFCQNGLVALEQTVNDYMTNCQFLGDGTGTGIRLGDGSAATEGWTIVGSIAFGFATGLHALGCNNSQLVASYLDACVTTGALIQSGVNASTNWLLLGNYIAMSGGSASAGIRCVSNVASSDPRGNRIIGNDILRYAGSGAVLSHGILIDGTQEIYNRIIGNNCSADTYACRVTSGSNHIVQSNNWVAGPFEATVMTTYEGNMGTNANTLMTRQTNGANFIYHVVGAAPAVAGVSYLRGDLAWEVGLTAGATPGYGCVTAGVAGASVWKAMAALAP